MFIPYSPIQIHPYPAYPVKKSEYSPSYKDEVNSYSGLVPVMPTPPMSDVPPPAVMPPPPVVPVAVNAPAPDFFSQLLSLKGLLYTGALLTGATFLGHSIAQRGVQEELGTLRKQVQAFSAKTPAVASKVKVAQASGKPLTEVKPKPAERKSVSIQTEPQPPQTVKIDQGVQVTPLVVKTKSQAVQTDLPAKVKATHPEQDIPLTEPDWTGLYKRYDETQGEMGYKISQLHKRAYSLPKPLQKPAVELKNNTIFYSLINHPDSNDRKLVGDVCELVADGKMSRADVLQHAATNDLRKKLSGDVRHFISQAREHLGEFHAYDQKTGSSLFWFWNGLARRDKALVQELEQKLNAYASTVKDLYQAVRLPAEKTK